jgi:hypothetical protein
MDWEIEDEVAMMDLGSDYEFTLDIAFWIDNTRPVPLEVDFSTETENEIFEIDDPGSITIDGNTNESFDITITGSGMDSNGDFYSAEEIFDTITLTASESVGGQNTGSRELSKDLQFTKVFELEPKASGSSKNTVVKAGTSETISIIVTNVGNSDDSVTSTTFSFRGCPQMDYNIEEPLEGMVRPGVPISQSLELLASNSHPEKGCTLVITAASEGAGRSFTGEFEFNVEAPSQTIDEPDENKTGDLRDTDFCDTYDCEDNSLPNVPMQYILSVIFWAAILRRE